MRWLFNLFMLGFILAAAAMVFQLGIGLIFGVGAAIFHGVAVLAHWITSRGRR